MLASVHLTLNGSADWVTILLAPAGLVVSVAGFWIAISQISKTKSVAEAARTAATRTSRSLVQNHILFLIPELERLALEIENAADAQDSARTRELLSRWRMAATRARGLVKARGDVPADLATAFAAAFKRVGDARAALRGTPPDFSITAPALKTIDKVLEEMGDLGGELLGESGEDDGVE